MGWIRNHRPGNDGGAGNTLEDLLGIKENNLPIADTKEWELKTQKTKENYITLFHMDPYPRGTPNIVTDILLPKYGWKHKTILREMSFRATLSAPQYTDRGFKVKVNKTNQKVLISFDYSKVGDRHAEWLERVISLAGNGEINPQPFWSFDMLEEKIEKKNKNTCFVRAEKRVVGGHEEFLFNNVWMLKDLSFNLFIQAIENGDILIDFDARTHHNHGTKFRTADMDALTELYSSARKVV